jgi:hypothetical protein
MSTELQNARKRKTAYPVDTVASDNGTVTVAKGQSRRVSKDTAETGTGTPNTPNSLLEMPEMTTQSIQTLIQSDLFHQDIVVVETALYYLNTMGLTQDDEKCEEVVRVGGCLALVALVKNHLERFQTLFPKYEQLTCSSDVEEGEIQPGFAERGVLHEAFSAIKALAYNNKASANFIATYGGIEAAIAAMEAFPFCGELQGVASGVLCNLTSKESDHGVTKAMVVKGVESGDSYHCHS